MPPCYVSQIKTCTKAGLRISILDSLPDPFAGSARGEDNAPRILVGKGMKETNDLKKIRLSRPIRPKQPKDLAAMNAKRQMIDRGQISVTDRDILERDSSGIHHESLSARSPEIHRRRE